MHTSAREGTTATLAPGSSVGYLPQLDGLRSVAVGIVLFSHGSLLLWPDRLRSGAGSLGVTLFFVLSGYLICLLLVRERDAYSRIDVPAFLVRRGLRIWPLYYGLLAFYWLASLGTGIFRVNEDLIPHHLLFLQNYLVPDESLGLGLALLWTLAVEEHVYLALPLVLAWIPRRSLLPAVAAITLASLFVRQLALTGTVVIGNTYKATHTNVGILLVGALLALAVVQWPSLQRRLGHPFVLVAGSVAFGLVWLAGFVPVSREVRALLPVSVPWMEVWASLLLVAWAQAQASDRGSWLTARALVRLGRLSYGIYLLHPVVGRLMQPWFDVDGARLRRGIAMPLMWLLTWLLAEAVYRGYEVHFLRLKRRFTRVVSRPID